MAVLNVRVEDQVRDRLKEMAEEEGVTLSEYVRDLLLEAVVPVYEHGNESEHGDQPAPETMRLIDRQVLSQLHRILARVLPEDSNDVDGDMQHQLERAEILERGYTGEYWLEVAGFRTELSNRDCRRVSDILQMFRVITFSIEHFAKEGAQLGEELARQLAFQGFDHNDALEGHMASYLEYQMKDDRWSELRPQIVGADHGNSHVRMLDTYSRMLAEYRRIMDGRERGFSRYDYLLRHEELEQITAARVHPSNRRPSE